MRCRVLFTAIAFTATVTVGAANACIIAGRTQLADVKGADVIVVGRITNYRLVLDQKRRDEDRRQFFKSGKWLNPKNYFNRPSSYVTDYARFDIQVDEVLKGKAGKTLAATLDSWGEPERMASGPYIIALLQPDSRTPPVRAAAINTLPALEKGTLTVVTRPCSGALIFDGGSQNVTSVRLILRGRPLPNHLPVAPLAPRYITASWAAFPSDEDRARFYPPRARDDEVEGTATVDCVATKTGGVASCHTVFENPPRYGFGDATAGLVQAKARMKAGTYHSGDRLKVTLQWNLG